jgi:hypothetical protein
MVHPTPHDRSSSMVHPTPHDRSSSMVHPTPHDRSSSSQAVCDSTNKVTTPSLVLALGLMMACMQRMTTACRPLYILKQHEERSHACSNHRCDTLKRRRQHSGAPSTG